MNASDADLPWAVRAFVYRHFAETAQPPTVEEAAGHFRCSREAAAQFYEELHRRHALFLEPRSTAIRMANPFSAIPTAFRVLAQGRAYWANCAWDALGIPAALHCDASIETADPTSGLPLKVRVRDGVVLGHGQVVHFLLSFRQWYDDLVFT